MKTLIIDSERQKTYAKNLIDQMPIDGSDTVEIKKTDKSSTAKQRRLQWQWYTDVSLSGLGQNDTKEGVHLRAKWKYARPILLRDDELFGLIYEKFMEVVSGSELYSEYCREFCRQYISTEKLSRKQRAEYLTEFERFWRSQGVALTDPATQGLDERLGWTPK